MADAEGRSAPDATPMASRGIGRTLFSLVRREFWEHRALWISPAVVAALIVIAALIASIKYRVPTADLHFSDNAPPGMTMFAVMQSGVSSPLAAVMIIVTTFYLLDCLYAERKDRSILFWKSLPVSDGMTVVSKLLVAGVIVPLGVFVLGLLVSLACTGIWEVNAALGRLPAIPGWDMLGWLQAELALLLCFITGMLWYAPCAAYLLVLSAWARRATFVWLLLPPVVGEILEHIAFHTHYLQSFITYRMFGIWPKLFSHMHIGHGRAFALGSGLDQLDLGAVLGDIDLWLGLVAAAGLTFAAVRIRRYRDDT